jgi:hypothetical protein
MKPDSKGSAPSRNDKVAQLLPKKPIWHNVAQAKVGRLVRQLL